ncbi:MAG: hotdog domain-containing protein [Candidatus Acidiferrales bacterium]|jgi:fluoroacetyl-CoA thioesterase
MKTRKTTRAKRVAKRTAKPTVKSASTVHRQGPRIGLEATIERVVQPEHTIQAVNPNLPAVFSTPSMIGLMEHASVVAVLPDLPPGVITVGTRIEVDHLKAVGPGATVQASARFVEYQGRFLVFDVEARSGEHVIGRGRVFRAMVEPEKHGAKAKARVQK